MKKRNKESREDLRNKSSIFAIGDSNSNSNSSSSSSSTLGNVHNREVYRSESRELLRGISFDTSNHSNSYDDQYDNYIAAAALYISVTNTFTAA